MEKKTVTLVIFNIIAILFILFVGSLTAVNPFYGDINFIDEGQIAVWVHHLFVGKVVYKDFFMSYGPLFVFPYFIGAKLLGQSVSLIRIVTALIFFFPGFLIVQYVIKMCKPPIALFYTSLVLLLLIPGISLRQEIGFFVLVCLLSAFDKESKNWAWLAGISSCVSFLISPEIGIFSFIIALLFFVYQYVAVSTGKKTTIFSLYYLSGLMSSFVVFALYALAHGWLSDYITNTNMVLTVFSGVNSPNGMNFPYIVDLLSQNSSLYQWIHSFISQQMLLYWVLLLFIITAYYLFIKFIGRTITHEDKIIVFVLMYSLLLFISIVGRPGHFF